jgi:1-acyl-sn-glycerol-3-phosphate acyltransferase
VNNSKEMKTSYLKLVPALKEIFGFIKNTGLITLREKDLVSRRRAYIENTSARCVEVLKSVGFTIKVDRQSDLNLQDQTYFIVANHLSYLDVLILASLMPSVFVTSREMEQAFFLGFMATAGGSLFVERRSPYALKRDIAKLKETSSQGFQLVVFPEGTSGSGGDVMPFKKGLFKTATDLQLPVLPVCIKYKTINGEPFAVSNRDQVCWYGDMPFLNHFLNLRKIESVEVELKIFEPIPVRPESLTKELAQQAHSLILAEYRKELDRSFREIP